MDPSILLCGRETRSAFSYEYSYFSLIFVENSSFVIVCSLALVFHASLVRAVSFVIIYSHILLFNYLERLYFTIECVRWYN